MGEKRYNKNLQKYSCELKKKKLMEGSKRKRKKIKKKKDLEGR